MTRPALDVAREWLRRSVQPDDRVARTPDPLASLAALLDSERAAAYERGKTDERETLYEHFTEVAIDAVKRAASLRALALLAVTSCA
jgi:hypothetical protein